MYPSSVALCLSTTTSSIVTRRHFRSRSTPRRRLNTQHSILALLRTSTAPLSPNGRWTGHHRRTLRGPLAHPVIMGTTWEPLHYRSSGAHLLPMVSRDRGSGHAADPGEGWFRIKDGVSPSSAPHSPQRDPSSTGWLMPTSATSKSTRHLTTFCIFRPSSFSSLTDNEQALCLCSWMQGQCTAVLRHECLSTQPFRPLYLSTCHSQASYEGQSMN